MAKTDQELAQELSDQLGLDWRSQYSGRNREQVPRRTQTISADRPTIRSALSNLMRDAIDATGIGGGYRRGLLNAAGGIETGVDFTPVLGDALALEDAAQAYRRGDLIDTGINLIGAIPIAGEFLSKGAKLTKEQIEEGAMSSLREALNVPIEKFRALMGAPRYGGPLSGSGYNARDSRWAMISAENPPNQRLTDAENIRRSEELGEYLIKEYGPDNISLVKGDYGGPERTYLVEGIDPIAAANIGNRYGQDSVFTDRGILYTSGSGRMGQREQISPLTGRYGEPVYQPNIDPDLTSFYTELQPKTGDPIRLSFNIDANTPLTYPSGDLTPASARGVHFSNQAGLTETDPIHYGEGSAGAEKAFVGAGRRAYGEGPLRTYFYTPSGLASDVVPEPVVTGANRYQTTLRDLYDITTDPEGIRAFSKGPVDMERMIESRGYTGYLSNALANPEAGRTGSAAVFSRQPVISTDAAEAISGIAPRMQSGAYQASRVAADPRVADNPVAMRMNDQIASDFDGAIQRYSQIDRTKGGKVINADYARELSDDYLADRTLANEVQAPSSEFARALFDRRLSETQGQDGIWILTGGGTASGKSAGVSGEVEDLADLVYDGTMKDFDKTDRMVSAAADSGKKVRLVYVDRDPDKALPLYFNRARDEGRTVPLDVFVDSHRGARDTIRRLSEKYADDPRVDIQIWSNQGREGEQKIIDISELSDFDADEIMPRLERMVDEEYEQGKISTAVYNATKGRL